MNCAKCGTRVNPGDLFCGKCGTTAGTGSFDLVDQSEHGSSFATRKPAARRRSWLYVAGTLVVVIALAGLTILGYQFFSGPTETGDDVDPSPGDVISEPDRSGEKGINSNSHAFRISDLVVLKQPEAEEVDIMFDVFDETGDSLAFGEAVMVSLTLVCGQSRVHYSSAASKIVMKDAKNGRVYTDFRSDIGSPQGTCDLLVSMPDKDGNESNQLKTRVKGV